MDAALTTALVQGGPVGIFALYLIWDRWTTAKERASIDKERIEVDRQVAASLAALTTVIQSERSHV